LARSAKLNVHAGNHARNTTLVQADLPWTNVAAVSLRDAKTGKRIPCQVEKTRNGIRLVWFASNLKAGDTQRLIAEPSDSQDVAVEVSDAPDGSKVEVRVAGKPFTAYNYGDRWVRPFLFPVIGPYDTQVTRSWPMVDLGNEAKDHPHHKSIWVAYGECDKVDNWSEEPGHGYQVHDRFLAKTSGPVYGRIAARIHWLTSKRKKQFEETRDMRFYALPGGERLIDIGVSFKMTEGPVTFRDTKEGGLVSVRVASAMEVPNGGCIENAYGGINEDETWGKKAPWCDYSGWVNGKHVGIAIMDNPDNPRYPTGWHVRNYGLMTANCFAWKYYRPEKKEKGDMPFPKGSTTEWRYRLLIHKGDAHKGKVKDRFIDYIAPPTITVD
jgi:hypothetical protein